VKPSVKYIDLGLISYQNAWDYQTNKLKEIVDVKIARRTNPLVLQKPHCLIFCEHPHVYTMGRSGSMQNLLIDENGLKEADVEFFKINRGGDITYHGPGQIVGYPIFDLDEIFTDIHKYVRFLEEAIIQTLAEYNIIGSRIKEYTGVWIVSNIDGQLRKICAIGVHMSRWVTMHGFAFNINSDLHYFDNIIPCGIVEKDKSVTSLSAELGKQIDIEIVKEKVKNHLVALFNLDLIVE
jgi:lipoyl(octanoyl) transferase